MKRYEGKGTKEELQERGTRKRFEKKIKSEEVHMKRYEEKRYEGLGTRKVVCGKSYKGRGKREEV